MARGPANLEVRLPLVVTMGEPAGIGPEIVLKSWLARDQVALPPFLVAGNGEYLRVTAKQLGLDVPVIETDAEGAIEAFPGGLPVLAHPEQIHAVPGKPDRRDGGHVCHWIREAVRLSMCGKAAAIVTAPINKHALYESGFQHPGHTEYLAALAGEADGGHHLAVMMLAGPQLRTVPLTIHIPLSEVPGSISGELIIETARIVHRDLRARFGIADPVLAVSGLNPHAGEQGSMGREEIEIIIPALEVLRATGMRVNGPLPADTMFHASARKTYDTAICMYHDQALIPAKTLAFDEAVNVTLGLPFIRTSPDHGTALDIAGRGIADPSSMIAAITMAGEMAACGAQAETC